MTDISISLGRRAAFARTVSDAIGVRHRAALLGIVLAGAALRFFALGQESYWLDEISMLTVAGGSFDAAARSVLTGRPPVFVVLLNLWIDLFGTSEAATRAFTALVSTAALLLLYRVGSRLLGPRAALAATVLMALAPIQLYQAQNIRYYALVVLLALLAFEGMLMALQEGRTAGVALAAAASVLLFYTHPYGVFVVGAQDLYLLLTLRRHRAIVGRWLAGRVAWAAAVAPYFVVWYGLARADEIGAMHWLPPATLPMIPVTLTEYVAFDLPGLPAIAAALVLLAVGVAAARREAAGARRRGGRSMDHGGADSVRRGLLLGCWLAVPILAPFMLSQILGPMYLTRYTLGASPALYLLLGWGIAAAAGRVAFPWGVAAAAVLVLPSTVRYYPREMKEDWRGMSAYLDGAVRDGDRILLVPWDEGEAGRALHWYYHAPTPVCGLDGSAAPDPRRVAAEVRRCTAGAGRVWLIARGPETITGPFVHHLLQNGGAGLAPVESRSFTGIELHLLAPPAPDAGQDMAQ